MYQATAMINLEGARALTPCLMGDLVLPLGLRQPSDKGLLGTELPHGGVVAIQTHGI